MTDDGMRRFRFGVGASSREAGNRLDTCRAVEEDGSDVLPDHLGVGSPFVPPSAAVDGGLRPGPSVLDNGFRDPPLLPREAATLDRGRDGRFA